VVCPGFIPLPRDRAPGSEWWRGLTQNTRLVFLSILTCVQWRDAVVGEEVIFDGTLRLLKIGDCLTSERALAELAGVSNKAVRSALQSLSQGRTKGRTIALFRAHKGAHKGTLLTIIDTTVLEALVGKKGTQKGAQIEEMGRTKGQHTTIKQEKQDKQTSPESALEGSFSPEVERVFALAVTYLEEAGHKIPDTPKRIEDAKNTIRLMIERDDVPAEEVMDALDYVSQDTGNGNGSWPGWGSVVQSIPGFRQKFPKFRDRAAQWAAAQREAGLTWRPLTEVETRARLKEAGL